MDRLHWKIGVESQFGTGGSELEGENTRLESKVSVYNSLEEKATGGQSGCNKLFLQRSGRKKGVHKDPAKRGQESISDYGDMGNAIAAF